MTNPLAAVVTSALICMSSAATHAASFDCKKAVSRADQILCADGFLSAMDSEVGRLYTRGLQIAPNRAAFAAEGRRLWAERQKCDTAECVSSWLQTRQSHLRWMIDQHTIATLEAAGNYAAADRYRALVNQR